MKNYNKILEAINRGIQLALDDFDDDVQIQNNIKSKQVQNKDYTKEYLDLTKELVDLGLPSGTLWFNYNYGVDHKKIYEYTKPEDFYGLYLSWAEKNIKRYYDWDVYVYCKYPQREKRKLIKYCNSEEYWGMPYGIPVEKAEKAIEDIIAKVKEYNNVKGCRYLGVTELADSSIQYLLEVNCEPQFKLQVRRDTLKSILLGLADNNIEVPFTQIDVHNK